jgi:hypothetical protein
MILSREEKLQIDSSVGRLNPKSTTQRCQSPVQPHPTRMNSMTTTCPTMMMMQWPMVLHIMYWYLVITSTLTQVADKIKKGVEENQTTVKVL